jgi:hypothetical protein
MHDYYLVVMDICSVPMDDYLQYFDVTCFKFVLVHFYLFTYNSLNSSVTTTISSYSITTIVLAAIVAECALLND